MTWAGRKELSFQESAWKKIHMVKSLASIKKASDGVQLFDFCAFFLFLERILHETTTLCNALNIIWRHL